jgi:hypothetical protein
MMKSHHLLIRRAAGGMLALLLGLQVAGLPAADKAKDKSTDKVAPVPVITYDPPLRGVPRTRVGAGTRGSGDAAVLQVLAPDHIGLTTAAQPTLYWYASTPCTARFEVALIDEEGIEPLVDVDTEGGKTAGIRHLNLEDHGVSLQPGVTYQWSVALVADGGSCPSGLVASGVIERVVPDERLASRIKDSSGVNRVAVLAGEGIWYDALHELSSLIAESPEDGSLPAIRDDLLKQVGLQVVTGH